MLVDKGLSKENKLLLSLLANALFDAQLAIDVQQIDLKLLFTEAMSQGVLALAFDALPQEARACDKEIYDLWQMYAFSIMQKNASQMHANAEVEKIFEEAGLPVCTIKGFASDYYYGAKKHLRQMGDIDFAVPAGQIEAGKTLLLENGFVRVDDEDIHDFHITFKKGSEIYEMHKGITWLLEGNAYLEEYMEDIFFHARKVNLDSVTVTVPDMFSHGLIMLLHMQRHMLTGGGIGLRHLCDWAVFVNSVPNDEWCRAFEEKLKNLHLWTFAKALSKVSSLYLRIEEKEWFSQFDHETAEALLQDILLSGSFGYKDSKRYQEIFFLSKTHKKESLIHMYAESMIYKVYAWKSVFKRFKILLPIGMVAYIVRTSFLVVFCKKKINFSQIKESGKTRNDLYHKIFK